jgi:acyl-CoA thioester hydrolase
VIIAHAECDFRSPAHFGDELEVRVGIGEIGRSSFTLVYEIVDAATERLVATGKTVMVSYDYEKGASTPLPEATRALLGQLRPKDAEG